MALKIVWTPQADKGLTQVIDYLEKEWTVLEIRNLEENLKNLLILISQQPKICPASKNIKNVRKGLVDKNNYIIYRIKPRKKIIEIINFRGTKQSPL